MSESNQNRTEELKELFIKTTDTEETTEEQVESPSRDPITEDNDVNEEVSHSIENGTSEI